MPSLPKETEDVTYPCPACGEKLWGWVAARDPAGGPQVILDRCEDCGLTVTRGPQPPDIARELADLRREGDELVAPNRESFQGGMGAAQWSALDAAERRLHLTPRSADLLLAERGTEVLAVSTPFSAESFRAMTETFVNAFTLHDNFVRHARNGRIPRRTAKQKASYWLDRVVSVLVFVPAAVVAAPIEWVGSKLGRGGVMRLKVREGDREASAASVPREA